MQSSTGSNFRVLVHQSGELEALLEKHGIIPKAESETETPAASTSA